MITDCHAWNPMHNIYRGRYYYFKFFKHIVRNKERQNIYIHIHLDQYVMNISKEKKSSYKLTTILILWPIIRSTNAGCSHISWHTHIQHLYYIIVLSSRVYIQGLMLVLLIHVVWITSVSLHELTAVTFYTFQILQQQPFLEIHTLLSNVNQ